MVKPSSNQAGPSSKVKIESSAMKNKKIESSSFKQTADSRQTSVSTVTKTEVKSTTTTSSSSKTKTTKGRQKKVYSFPGQRYDPPEEREPLRIFYESLHRQIPASEMAEFWMMEHGLLSPERAKRAYDKKQRKQKMQRTGTPIKYSKPQSKTESSQKQQASKNGELKAKKRIINDSKDGDDFVLSSKKRKG